MGSYFFTELNQAQPSTAIDGSVLVEFSSFHKRGDEFDIDLDQIAWARDDEAAAVAFGFRFASTGETLAFNDFCDRRGPRQVFRRNSRIRRRRPRLTDRGE